MINTISITYALKYKVKGHSNYKISACNKVFNTKTGRQLKRCYNAGSIGYWINRKFITVANLRRQAIKIEQLPF